MKPRIHQPSAQKIRSLKSLSLSMRLHNTHWEQWISRQQSLSVGFQSINNAFTVTSYVCCGKIKHRCLLWRHNVCCKIRHWYYFFPQQSLIILVRNETHEKCCKRDEKISHLYWEIFFTQLILTYVTCSEDLFESIISNFIVQRFCQIRGNKILKIHSAVDLFTD